MKNTIIMVSWTVVEKIHNNRTCLKNLHRNIEGFADE